MSQLLNEIKQDLYGVKDPITEEKKDNGVLMEMVFGDHRGMNPSEINNPGYDTSAGGPEPEMSDREADGDMNPINGKLPSETVNDPEIQSILSNIRLAVIKGLAKLAEKPQSVEYDTLKKILGIVDKPIETQNKIK